MLSVQALQLFSTSSVSCLDFSTLSPLVPVLTCFQPLLLQHKSLLLVRALSGIMLLGPNPVFVTHLALTFQISFEYLKRDKERKRDRGREGNQDGVKMERKGSLTK